MRAYLSLILLLVAPVAVRGAAPPSATFTLDPQAGFLMAVKFPYPVSGTPSVTLIGSSPNQGATTVRREAAPATIAPDVDAGKPVTIVTIRVPEVLLVPRVSSKLEAWIDGLATAEGPLGTVSVSVTTGLSSALLIDKQTRLIVWELRAKGLRYANEVDSPGAASSAGVNLLQAWLATLVADTKNIEVTYVAVDDELGVTRTARVEEIRVKEGEPFNEGEGTYTLSTFIRVDDADLPAGRSINLSLAPAASAFLGTAAGEYAGRYPELMGRITEKGVSVPAGPGIGVDAEHKFKNNLEIGGTFTSVVTPKTDPVTSLPVRSRDNLGVLDLQFIPLLKRAAIGVPEYNWTTGEVTRTPWERYYTPLIVDLTVSTGPELKNSQKNHVGFATEYEWRRWYPGIDVTSSLHRFLLRGAQDSDRDFKDFDRTAQFEYHFSPGPWQGARFFTKEFRRAAQVDLTVVGVDLGWRSTTRNDFELGELKRPLDKNQFTRRLRFGGTFDWEIYDRLALHVEDMVYVRGGDEYRFDRAKNYFKGRLEAPFWKFDPYKSVVAFVQFERGDVPPFTTPSINSFQVGFRFRLNWDSN